MLAVLEDAIACIQAGLFKPSCRNEKLFQEAEEWINAIDDGVFSFTNVCETLGFRPAGAQKGTGAVEGRTDNGKGRGQKAAYLKQREVRREEKKVC